MSNIETEFIRVVCKRIISSMPQQINIDVPKTKPISKDIDIPSILIVLCLVSFGVIKLNALKYH